ncbi:hypothetical protein C8Q77DRAFT_843738 [Trametes polyzona]|nr:hypothetical protein C8Q77DRAFT_843738 [Trametes polyzona]
MSNRPTVADPINLAFHRAAQEDDARRRPPSPFDGLMFRDEREALAFADSIIRSPNINLYDYPPKLLLGYETTARPDVLVPGDVTLRERAEKLWSMLRCLVHLRSLNIEDGDAILQEIPAAQLDAAPLDLPYLTYLTYRMSYSVDYWHALLSHLRSAHLIELMLRYPLDYERDSDQCSSDLVSALSYPSIVPSLESLHVENLQYEYLDFSRGAAVPKFVNVVELALHFALNDSSPRLPIIGYLLAAFPNVTDLDINTTSAPFPTDPLQNPPISEVRRENLRALQASGGHRWRLKYLTAGLLDLFLFGLGSPSKELSISELDMYTIQAAGNQLLENIFGGVTPRGLLVNYLESQLSPSDALIGFLDLLRAYWASSPATRVPEELRLDLRMVQRRWVASLLHYALILINVSGTNLHSYTLDVHFRCKRLHRLPPPRTSTPDSEEEAASAMLCVEGERFFYDVGEALKSYAGVLEGARSRGIGLFINGSTWCSHSTRRYVAMAGGGTGIDRVQGLVQQMNINR